MEGKATYSRIRSTGGALPARSVTNDELAQELAARGIETSDEWIRTRTGIRSRCLAAEGETTLTLAEAAARRALEAGDVSPAEIDLVIVATTTPDQIFPAVAARLQAALGVPPCGAFDIQAVCSGFAYALSVADSMIRSGAVRRALVVGADTLSRLIDWNDRKTCVLFGDGAGAVVLEASDEPGILACELVAEGARADILYAPGRIEGGKLVGDGFLLMDGRAVFKEAVVSLEATARKVLERAPLAVSEVDWYVPHQANLRIMTHVADRLGIPAEKLVATVASHGNTCAASVPLALDAAVRDGRVKRGDAVLLQGVGAGMTCGAVLLRF